MFFATIDETISVWLTHYHMSSDIGHGWYNPNASIRGESRNYGFRGVMILVQRQRDKYHRGLSRALDEARDVELEREAILYTGFHRV